MITLTAGQQTSERKITWIAMLAGVAAIAAQIAGQLLLQIDLGVDIDVALLSITGGGALYTISRKLLKGVVAKADATTQAPPVTPPAVLPPLSPPAPTQPPYVPPMPSGGPVGPTPVPGRPSVPTVPTDGLVTGPLGLTNTQKWD